MIEMMNFKAESQDRWSTSARARRRRTLSLLLAAGLTLSTACGGEEDTDAESPNGFIGNNAGNNDGNNDGNNAGNNDGNNDGSCIQRDAVAPEPGAFTDISDDSGIRKDNYVQNPPVRIPINDHSRLGFVDLNGDGFDDVVAHSLYPNPQAGVPFEHLVFLNNGDGTFSDHSDASGLRDIQAGFFAFGDMDNDGDQDVFAGLDIGLAGATHQVWLNDGQGVFTLKANSGVEAMSPTAGNAVFLDYDGDAVLDLFVGHGHTSFRAPDSLLRGLGDGTFVDVTNLLTGNRQVPTNGSVVCDYDNDGDMDIFVSTYSVSTQLGANILFENVGGRFEDVAVARGFASQPGGNTFLASTNYGLDPEPGKGPGQYVGSNGFGIDCADINNDGHLDVYLATISHPVNSDYGRKWSDPSQILINQGPDGAFAFSNDTIASLVPFNEGDIDAAIVDFDNDGLFDLSVTRDSKYERNYDNVEQKSWFGLMRQSARGTFEHFGPDSGINDLDTSQSASLTMCTDDSPCLDGEVCLSDRCRIPCQVTSDCPSQRETCHTGGFCRALVSMKKGQNHAWSDIDRDGDMDLLVGGRDTGGGRPNFLFRNDVGAQNRWIAFEVQGDGEKVNRDGIGTRVSLVFSDRTLTRELHTSRGTYNSSDMRALHFGLGGLPCDYTIEVRWPDGTTTTLDRANFDENAYHTLSYSE